MSYRTEVVGRTHTHSRERAVCANALGEAPLLRLDDLLAARELELGTAQRLDGGGTVVVAGTDGHQHLADLHTRHNTLRLAVRVAHTSLQTIGASAGKHLVDAVHVERVHAHAQVERVLAAQLGHGLVGSHTRGLKCLRGQLWGDSTQSRTHARSEDGGGEPRHPPPRRNAQRSARPMPHVRSTATRGGKTAPATRTTTATGAYLLTLIGHQVAHVREAVDGLLLGGVVVDTDLGVRDTAAVPGLDERLVLAVAVAASGTWGKQRGGQAANRRGTHERRQTEPLGKPLPRNGRHRARQRVAHETTSVYATYGDP